MELLLIRHGLPLRVSRPDGIPADPPLSDDGAEQARALAEWLDPMEIHALYVSPLRRARETAVPLAERRSLEMRVESGVVEFDPHASEYIPLEQLKANDYPRWQEMMAGGLHAGIDLATFRATVARSLEAIIRSHSGERVAVVCHGGVINTWAAHVLGLEDTLFFDPTYTSVNRFLAASSGERSIVSLNEAAHLRGL